MAAIFKSITETIIGNRCEERFLPLHRPGAQPLTQAGIVHCGVSVLHPPYQICRPAQNFLLLMCTARGQGEFRIGGRRGKFKAGSAWLVGPGQDVSYRLCGARWDIFWFHLKSQNVSGPESSGLCQLCPEYPEALRHLMLGYLAECATSPEADNGLVSAWARLIAAAIDRLRGPQLTTSERTTAHALAALWREVGMAPQRRWTVEDLARQLHVSAPHFFRLVLRFNATTPQGMVTRLRMQEAQKLLYHTDQKLDRIAEQLGYGTPFAFSRAFKKEIGLSPASFRRQHFPSTTEQQPLSNKSQVREQ